jgi:hypothetical protein
MDCLLPAPPALRSCTRLIVSSSQVLTSVTAVRSRAAPSRCSRSSADTRGPPPLRARRRRGFVSRPSKKRAPKRTGGKQQCKTSRGRTARPTTMPQSGSRRARARGDVYRPPRNCSTFHSSPTELQALTPLSPYTHRHWYARNGTASAHSRCTARGRLTSLKHTVTPHLILHTATAEQRTAAAQRQKKILNPSDGTVPFPGARLRGRAGAVIDGGRPREGCGRVFSR